MKQCTSCLLNKSMEDFHKNPGCKDGRNSLCKKCHHAVLAKKRKDPTQKEKFRQYQRRSGMKARYVITPEIFDKMVEKSLEYLKKHS